MFLRRKEIVTLGSRLVLLTTRVLKDETLLLGLGNFLIVKAELQPADLIHVLGGPRDRPKYALRLFEQGYSEKLLFTGREIAPCYKGYAIWRGVPPENLINFESIAQNTYGEAQELKQILEREPAVRSIILVSSPYHLRRARWTFKTVLGNSIKLQFAPVPFELSYEKQRWWADSLSRQMVVGEYLKLLFYYVRY